MSLSHYDAPTGAYTTKIPSGVTALRTFFKKKFGISRTEVIRNKSRCAVHGSEHCECGAIDLFPPNTVVGRAIFDWCVKHADAAGIQSVIYLHRQIGFGNPKERHRTKADHMDHVHVGLNRWARKNLTKEMLEALDEEDDLDKAQDARLKKVEKDVAACRDALFEDSAPPRQRDRIARIEKKVDALVKKLGA